MVKNIYKGLLNKRPKGYFGWVPILIVVIIGSFLYANNLFTVVDVNPNLTKNGDDIFLKYLFIIVAVERAAAVFVGIIRSQNQANWNARIKRINEVLRKDEPSIELLKQMYARERRLTSDLEEKKEIGKIKNVPNNANLQDYIGFLTSVKYAYEFKRSRYNAISKKYVARTVFFAGIVLSAFGISIFQDIIQNMNLVSAVDEEIKRQALVKAGVVWQSGLLRFADILVTGGLLGGGSTALNEVANRVSDLLNREQQ